jgi:hypothetical protein
MYKTMVSKMPTAFIRTVLDISPHSGIQQEFIGDF